MARKKAGVAKQPKECMFLGDSKELKVYLSAKKKFFEQLLKTRKTELSSEQNKKITGFIEAIDEMLDQKYFRGKRIYSMSEIIEEIKLEREDLLKEIVAVKLEVERARELANAAFKAEKCYYANKYEKAYETPGQIELRHLVDEYQLLQSQQEGLEKCRKALWWLLGVIHRPSGFFEKVVEESNDERGCPEM